MKWKNDFKKWNNREKWKIKEEEKFEYQTNTIEYKQQHMSEEEKSLNKDLEEESEKSVKNDESEKSSVESEESEESESGESPLSDAKDESDDEDEPVDNLGVKRNVDDDISEKDINDYFDDTVEEKVPKKSKRHEVKKTKAELEQEEDEKKRREMDQIIEVYAEGGDLNELELFVYITRIKWQGQIMFGTEETSHQSY